MMNNEDAWFIEVGGMNFRCFPPAKKETTR